MVAQVTGGRGWYPTPVAPGRADVLPSSAEGKQR